MAIEGINGLAPLLPLHNLQQNNNPPCPTLLHRFKITTCSEKLTATVALIVAPALVYYGISSLVNHTVSVTAGIVSIVAGTFICCGLLCIGKLNMSE